MNEQPNNGNIILYQTEDGKSRIEVTLCNDTVWLTADQMAELFQRNKSTISRHIKNVFEDGELNPDSTVAFFATVQNEGDRTVERNLAYYNLDMIISVGYRVKSHTVAYSSDSDYEDGDLANQIRLYEIRIYTQQPRGTNPGHASIENDFGICSSRRTWHWPYP